MHTKHLFFLLDGVGEWVNEHFAESETRCIIVVVFSVPLLLSFIFPSGKILQFFIKKNPWCILCLLAYKNLLKLFLDFYSCFWNKKILYKEQVIQVRTQHTLPFFNADWLFVQSGEKFVLGYTLHFLLFSIIFFSSAFHHNKKAVRLVSLLWIR